MPPQNSMTAQIQARRNQRWRAVAGALVTASLKPP
jgi:hypothetical protein